jgi:enoyl-CoA hydratase/carnithine racemase
VTETERNLVDYDCQDHIATITLNRAEKLNAFSYDMVAALAAALRRFDMVPAGRFLPAPMCSSANCAGARSSKSMAARRGGERMPEIC